MSYMRNEASDFEKQILKESVVIPSSNPAIQVSYYILNKILRF